MFSNKNHCTFLFYLLHCIFVCCIVQKINLEFFPILHRNKNEYSASNVPFKFFAISFPKHLFAKLTVHILHALLHYLTHFHSFLKILLECLLGIL